MGRAAGFPLRGIDGRHCRTADVATVLRLRGQPGHGRRPSRAPDATTPAALDATSDTIEASRPSGLWRLALRAVAMSWIVFFWIWLIGYQETFIEVDAEAYWGFDFASLYRGVQARGPGCLPVLAGGGRPLRPVLPHPVRGVLRDPRGCQPRRAGVAAWMGAGRPVALPASLSPTRSRGETSTCCWRRRSCLASATRRRGHG